MEPAAKTLVFNDQRNYLSTFVVFSKMVKSNEYCDINLVSENKQISVHKVFLAARAPFFRALFNQYGDTGEKEIKFNWLKFEILNLIVNYIYDFEVILTETNVQELFKAAVTFQLYDLRNACIEFLQTIINLGNCLELYLLAKSYNIETVTEKSILFIQKNSFVILSSDKFLSLTIEQLAAFINIVSTKNWKESPEISFIGLINWLKCDIVNRHKHFKNLMSLIQLKFVPEKQMIDKFKELISEKDALGLKLKLINTFKASISLQKNSDEYIPNKLYPFKCLLIAGGWHRGKITNSIQLFDFEKFETYFAPETMNSKRRAAGCSVLDSKLYITGGYTDINLSSVTSTVEMYDPALNKWTLFPNMQKATAEHSLVTLHNCLYAIGGFDGITTTNMMEIFNPIQLEWSFAPSMILKVAACGACILNNQIFVVGGMNAEKPIKKVQVYNPKISSWSFMTDMNIARYGPGVCTVNGTIYAVGGRGNNNVYLRSVERFNPETKLWTIIADMDTPRAHAGVVEYMECLYVVGGYNKKTVVSSAEYYNPKTNSWSPVECKSPLIRADACVAVINKPINYSI